MISPRRLQLEVDSFSYSHIHSAHSTVPSTRLLFRTHGLACAPPAPPRASERRRRGGPRSRTTSFLAPRALSEYGYTLLGMEAHAQVVSLGTIQRRCAYKLPKFALSRQKYPRAAVPSVGGLGYNSAVQKHHAMSAACSNTAQYYSGISGNAAALKSALHQLIDGHMTLSYSNVWNALTVLDADPSDSARVVGIYSEQSFSATEDRGVSTGWNREHCPLHAIRTHRLVRTKLHPLPHPTLLVCLHVCVVCTHSCSLAKIVWHLDVGARLYRLAPHLRGRLVRQLRARQSLL